MKTKITDKELLALGKKLMEASYMMDDWSRTYVKAKKEFWEKAKEIYPDTKTKPFSYDFIENTLTEDSE